jgi:hypothetical protein
VLLKDHRGAHVFGTPLYERIYRKEEPEKQLQSFFDFWNLKVKKGKVSEFSRLEEMALEAFTEWRKNPFP